MPTRQDGEPFVPSDFSPPTRLDHPAFRLRPLGPEHNQRDHAAWMGSIDHFRDRVGFTYTVLEPRGPAEHADVIGCVYIYPDDRPDTDVQVQSWVREDLADLDALLATTVRAWLEQAWPWGPEQIRDHPRHTAS